MDIYSQIITRIIEQQETIIGPVAVQQARQIAGIGVDWENHQVTLSGDARSLINQLVEQYRALFGQVAVEVSKEATTKFTAQLSEDQVPQSLK